MVNNKLRILCFGEAMVELSGINLKTKSSRIGFAGDTLNTAIYLKRVLAEDVTVDYSTVLGQDFFSDQLEEYLDSENIGTECVRRVDSRTVGLYAIHTDFSGERIFSYWRDRSAARLLFDRDEDFIKFGNYDLIYFSGISLAILPEIIRKKLLIFFENKERSFQIAFDSNYRPGLWENKKDAHLNIQRAFNCCDIGLPSLDDQMRLLNLSTEASVVSWFKVGGVSIIV